MLFIWAALREKVPNVLSHCHTKRRMGAQGMTMTQDIRAHFKHANKTDTQNKPHKTHTIQNRTIDQTTQNIKTHIQGIHHFQKLRLK